MDGVTQKDVLEALLRLQQNGQPSASSTEIAREARGSAATIRRHLEILAARGKVTRTGKARATRYHLQSEAPASVGEIRDRPAQKNEYGHPVWSPASNELRERLNAPLGMRDHVTYQREIVDHYVPNQSWLMPQALANELYQAGRLTGQQPAGTYARKVFEQLLLDLSWSSSRLEGNRYTLLATKELFERGSEGYDADAVMLLNHKAAIEFLVDSVPVQGLNTSMIRNLHAVLMQDLLDNVDALGAIRNTVVNISDTVFVPTQVPAILEEMLRQVVDKARQIKNPVEAAFFLWVNIAYLQPFEDGNKRTSRLAANIPLMLYNCAPLSFLDVDPSDYAMAMLGVYELRDVSVAVDLFAWTYRRSMKKYVVVMESLGAPDPRRIQYREALTTAVSLVVRERKSVRVAVDELQHTEDKAPGFEAMLVDALGKLEVFNCARYRLTMPVTQAWIDEGRPM